MAHTSETPAAPSPSACPAPGQPHDAPPPKAAKASDDSRHELWCHVQRSIRYHRAREAFFQWFANAFTFLTLMAGSGVVVSVLSTASAAVSIWCGIAVAAMQSLELVLQISQKARLHNSLASEFSAIERTMAKKPEMSQAEMNDLEADILMIEAREPPVKRYLDLICHNQVARAIGSDDIEPLTFWQRHLAHWRSGNTALQ
ncbi:hypothetical protein LO749_01645 [Paracoccus denitrificans]|uniref:hypothetical protein n=1 Tax=Paracoccus denitrificans TaxID=266 RepID=UPI001E580862|nr:hypothetical protein [Paracoccus denitrificans]UFS65299.1 hypothetical protein LO749_01645 [Paracoccus denitrificans]